jgi:hypothetical protein
MEMSPPPICIPESHLRILEKWMMEKFELKKQAERNSDEISSISPGSGSPCSTGFSFAPYHWETGSQEFSPNTSINATISEIFNEDLVKRPRGLLPARGPNRDSSNVRLVNIHNVVFLASRDPPSAIPGPTIPSPAPSAFPISSPVPSVFADGPGARAKSRTCYTAQHA